MNDAEELLRAALLKVPAGLAEHVMRVVDEAQRLAETHNIDREAARIAALGHDLLRAHSHERLLHIAAEQGYALDAVDRMEPILLHGPLAVPLLREQYKVLDAEVLGAIAYHTTAHAGMTRLQKLIFLSDKIEPVKRDRAPARIDRVIELAQSDLDAAMQAYLDYHVLYAIETGWPLHPNTVAARNELLAQRRPARRQEPLVAEIDEGDGDAAVEG
ncbi:MAG TPA: bis(5'-nucleosyl)-tetraphosphatase (symmetrical) YqeK [Dehalococcoidia bacterium]|nr:bis(5'-nucleosyl)-tetraphosphatase (symmetrical) YqeK [Dehalococcoidia bacterium]